MRKEELMRTFKMLLAASLIAAIPFTFGCGSKSAEAPAAPEPFSVELPEPAEAAPAEAPEEAPVEPAEE